MRACSLAELDAAGGLLAVGDGRREAVVVRAGGEVYALDRACPHEGYPLDEGDLLGETLTCPWHGWRFDVRSGACLTAGEDARRYRAWIQDGDVYVELDVEPDDADRARLRDDLVSALERGDAGRTARLVARLVASGGDLREVAAVVARYGATHGSSLDLATASVADAVALIAEAAPDHAVQVLADAASAVAELAGRALPRFAAQARSPLAFRDAAGTAQALASAVADRRADEAEGIVAGLLANGRPAREVAALLAAAASQGFRGVRPLLLVERAERLAGLGDEVGRAALAAAARAVASAPRLDGVSPYAGRPLEAADPGDLAADVGESLLRFDLALERDDHGQASLLRVAEVLAFVHAAAWSEDAAALAHAAWLAADVRAWRGTPQARHRAGALRLLGADAAASAEGTAICLAATRAALELDDESALAGVERLLATPRRERFVARAIAADRERPGKPG